MDKQSLLDMLAELDRHLATRHDIILVGGAAMILHFGAKRATRDVDALITGGDIQEFRAAVKAVSALHDLPEDWLNDAVKGFADLLPPDFENRLAPVSGNFQNLHAYFPGLPEQIVMKIVGLREQDLEDLEILMPRVNNSDKSILVANIGRIAKFRPDWALKIRYYLMEQGWEID